MTSIPPSLCLFGGGAAFSRVLPVTNQMEETDQVGYLFNPYLPLLLFKKWISRFSIFFQQV